MNPEPGTIYGWGLPLDASVHGHEIDTLIYLLHLFMGVTFLAGLIYFAYVLVRFRAHPDRRAVHDPGNSWIPLTVVVLVFVFEVILEARYSNPAFRRLRSEFPDPGEAQLVRVVAEQFAWNVHYPGPDRVFGKTRPELIDATINPLGLDPADPAGADDVTTINQLNVARGRPVIVYLTSKDVVHSFCLPVMRIRQDAIPGEVIPVWFEARETGSFEIVCAQLCGPFHYRMRGAFTIQEPAELAAWLEAKAAEGIPRGTPAPTDEPEFEEEFE